MKYWELIKVDGKPSTCKKTTQNTNKTDETADNIKKILELVQGGPITSVDTSRTSVTATSLNDTEVNNVMEWLLEYQERYFTDIPLPDSLDKNFVWNLPKKVYQAAEKNRLLEQPDVLNPLFWFYCMLLEEPEDMLPKFILTAFNAITDDDKDAIEQLSDQYDYNYGIYDEEDEEES